MIASIVNFSRRRKKLKRKLKIKKNEVKEGDREIIVISLDVETTKLPQARVYTVMITRTRSHYGLHSAEKSAGWPT